MLIRSDLYPSNEKYYLKICINLSRYKNKFISTFYLFFIYFFFRYQIIIFTNKKLYKSHFILINSQY